MGKTPGRDDLEGMTTGDRIDRTLPPMEPTRTLKSGGMPKAETMRAGSHDSALYVGTGGSNEPIAGDRGTSETVENRLGTGEQRPQLDVTDKTGTPGNLGAWKEQQEAARGGYTQNLEESGYKPRSHADIIAANRDEENELHGGKRER